MKINKRGIALLVLTVMVITAVAPLTSAAAEQTGTVVGGWLILRGSPSFNGAVLASYPSGTVVTITGSTGAWYSVRTPNGLTGYMNSAYLKVNGGGGGIPSGTTAYVTSSNGLNVRLRSGPGKGYSIIAAYAPGTTCTILTSGQNWSRIQIGSTTGYMMSQFLTSSPSPQPQPQPQPQPGLEYRVWLTSSNGNGVNLRSGPSKAYPSIGFYSVGTEAWMVTAGHTWSYIRIGTRYGYMMSQFLTDDYIDRVIEVLDSLYTDTYYSRMGVAWAVATAMAKYPEKCRAYMLSPRNHLDDWTYKKALQKMKES